MKTDTDKPLPKRPPGMFAKSMMKLQKSLNGDQAVTGSSTGSSGSGDGEFQAIRYDAVNSSKEPVHVMYLPDRPKSDKSPGSPISVHTPPGQSSPRQSMSLQLSPRKVSIGLQSSNPYSKKVFGRNHSEPQAPPSSGQRNSGEYGYPRSSSNPEPGQLHRDSATFVNNIYSITAGSSSSFASSLDPKSKVALLGVPTQPQVSDLSSVGLNLAGYGLSTDDLMPPPMFKPSLVNSSIQKSNSNSNSNSNSISTTSLHQQQQQPPERSIKRAQTSPMLVGSSTSSTLHSFNLASLNNQMPPPDIVDTLFEKLLSYRVFTDAAVKSLKEQSTKRKWELLLSENESNSSFDLKTLSKQIQATPTPTPTPTPPPQIITKIERSSSTSSESSLSKRARQHSTIKALSRIGISTSNSLSPSNDRKKSLESDTAATQLDPYASVTNTSTFALVMAPTFASLAKQKTKLSVGSPEWFVSRLMSNKLSVKEYKKLEKKLTKNTISAKTGNTWIQSFNEAQGETALGVILSRINKKSIKSNDEFEKEYSIVKCLKCILNNENEGAEAMAQTDGNSAVSTGAFTSPIVTSTASVVTVATNTISSTSSNAPSYVSKNKSHVIKAIIFSLISPRLATKILVTEILIFLSYYRGHEFLNVILDGMVNLQDLLGDFVRFQPWLSSVEQSLNKSFVVGVEGNDTNLKNYSLTTLLLINSIIEGTSSIKTRCSLRRELNDSRIIQVFEKIKVIGDDRIHEEIYKYEVFAEEDLAEYFQMGSVVSSSIGGPVSLGVDRAIGGPEEDIDLDDLYEEIRKLYSDNDDLAEHLGTIFQNLIMLRESGRNVEEVNKVLKVMNSVIHQIILESSMIGSDPGAVLNSSIQRLMDKLNTDDTARRAILESNNLSRTVSKLEREKQTLEEEISFGSNGLITNLKREAEINGTKMVSQQKQISLLQYQVKRLEEDKLKLLQQLVDAPKTGKVAASQIETTISPKLIAAELETVLSGGRPKSGTVSDFVYGVLRDDEDDEYRASDESAGVKFVGPPTPVKEFFGNKPPKKGILKATVAQKENSVLSSQGTDESTTGTNNLDLEKYVEDGIFSKYQPTSSGIAATQGRREDVSPSAEQSNTAIGTVITPAQKSEAIIELRDSLPESPQSSVQSMSKVTSTTTPKIMYLRVSLHLSRDN